MDAGALVDYSAAGVGGEYPDSAGRGRGCKHVKGLWFLENRITLTCESPTIGVHPNQEYRGHISDMNFGVYRNALRAHGFHPFRHMGK